MIPRKLTAILTGVSAGLIVLSAFAQTTPAHKKKKKKPKHTTTAPAASASASIEIDAPPAGGAAAAAPATSAAPAPAAPDVPAADTTPAAAAAGDANATDSASTDHAGASPAGGPWSAGLLLGWGFNAGAKLGFGVRGGYSIPVGVSHQNRIYVGAQFIYHLGESEFGGTANFLYPGVEVGYERAVGPLLVRPYLGLGPMILHESLPPVTAAGVTVAQGSNSTTYFAVWPGVTASYAITPLLFVGADFRYIISSYSMAGLFLSGGVRF